MRISDIPLSVLNRTLELFEEPRETDSVSAWRAIHSAEARKDVRPDFPGISTFAQAVAEYLSLSGPWREEGGEYSGESGVDIA
jgi:hypothetical protein